MTTETTQVGRPAAHPRPQLTRPGWTSLTGPWEHRADPAEVGLTEEWWRTGTAFERTIEVPFPPESAASGVEIDDVAIHWYRREVRLDPRPGMLTILHLEAVDFECDVWVDEQHVAHHVGGFTPFEVDVTPQVAARPDAPHVVVVRSRDDRSDLEQPRGKQDWEVDPHVIWYQRTSGIWREVWVEQVPEAHVAELWWRTDPIAGIVDLTVETSRATPPGAEVRVVLSAQGRDLASASGSVAAARAEVSLSLREAVGGATLEPLWWSPEHPVLLDARIELRAGGGSGDASGATDAAGTTAGAQLDAVGSYVGLRSARVDDRAFLLNERPYLLRLVLEQAYWPTSHLAAPSEAALEEEVRWIKRLGFNGLRMHQTSADPRFLELCDRLGLLVWVDSPASFRYSTTSLDRTVRGWLDLVRRDRSHPSVVTWVPFNESWGVEQVSVDPRQRDAVRALHHLTKALDPTRPVIGNDGWEYVAGDVVGVHDYRHDPDALAAMLADRAALVTTSSVSGRRVVLDAAGCPEAAEGRPVVLSEFGGFTLATHDGTWAGYGGVADGEELLERLESLVTAVVGSGIAGFCYTQLTDTEQERNGLLTEDREPKADPDRIAAAIRSGGVRR
ncbi:glycosyl hydrolase family 2 [Salana multivorans]|uniref:Glycosyl hydrolase family 2 n=1 Tax=Salana multivorans TaxID=120377 RepID=A0A3N2D7W5_9MICO|nr:glycoside hydrolase family 2 TIM barrel-domain containing protein [Salana multivorans]ROR95870.1 glycosyl hydrolase family 2 [Salana multivorans]